MSDPAVLMAAAKASLYRFAALAQTVLAPETLFQTSWVNRAVHYQLRAIEEGETTRLLLNVPNGYHNLLLIGIARIAWKLGRNPNQRFLVILPKDREDYYTIEQFMTELRSIFTSNFYSAIFPNVEPHQVTQIEFHTGDSGRIYITHASGQLPVYKVDHIISLEAEQDYDLTAPPRISDAADWLTNTAFNKLNNDALSTITVLNKRVSWADVSTLLKSDNYGNWKHLEMTYLTDDDNTYQIRRNGSQRTYTRVYGEALPEDPEAFNPAYEDPLQNMAFHDFLFCDDEDMQDVWMLFEDLENA